MKIWPLPDDDFELMKVLGNIIWNRLPDSKYKIMIRKHNLAIGAIIEDTNFVEGKFDSQYGKKLPWIKGFIPNNNGRFFLEDYEEPRNQKVANTGDLRDTIILETPIFILCARNSQSLNDDNDNFTWEVPENDVRQVMQMREFDNEQQIALSDLGDKVEEYRIVTTDMRTRAELFSRVAKKLQTDYNFLQKKNFELEKQVTEISRQNKQLSTNKLRDESMLLAEEQGAEDLGALQGMNKMDVIKNAAKDFKDVIDSISSIDKTDEDQILRDELKKQEKELAELRAKVEGEKKETPFKEEKK